MIVWRDHPTSVGSRLGPGVLAWSAASRRASLGSTSSRVHETPCASSIHLVERMREAWIRRSIQASRYHRRPIAVEAMESRECSVLQALEAGAQVDRHTAAAEHTLPVPPGLPVRVGAVASRRPLPFRIRLRLKPIRHIRPLIRLLDVTSSRCPSPLPNSVGDGIDGSRRT